MKRLTLKLHGLVQGVNFRFYAQQEARKLELSGWVMNNHDGTLGITAEGREADLHKLLEWAKEGPSGAEVSDVDTEWGNATGEFRGFSIVR